MSIVNISSENLVKGNDGEFIIQLKKPIQHVIGMQVLGLSVPLTYSIFNTQNYQFHYASAGHNRVVNLIRGTYSADECAISLEQAMNQLENKSGHAGITQNFLPYIRDTGQREYHIQYRDSIISIGERDEANYTGRIKTLSQKRVKAGWIVRFTVGSVVKIGLIENWDPDNGTGTFWERRPAQASGTVACTASQLESYYDGWLVYYDAKRSRMYIAAGGSCSGVGTFAIRGTPHNSTRMLKTFGFDSSETTDVGGSFSEPDEYWGFTRFLSGHDVPEPAGPSALFLRIGGDPILDQQNTETAMNDRIMIPIDQPHGGILHHHADAEADVIPFAVPCDVSRISMRIEYGDDNEIVGGKTDNLNGHHVFCRLKFFKQHTGHQHLGGKGSG